MSVQINTALKTFFHSGLKTNCETKPKSHTETCCCVLVNKKQIISQEYLQQRKCNYIQICKKRGGGDSQRTSNEMHSYAMHIYE